MPHDWSPLPLEFRSLSRVAGVDEVGRGPLAGPVVAAAVILPPDFDEEGLDDSKRLSARQREVLSKRIRAHAQIALCVLPAPAIDQMNIRAASLEAMRRAVLALPLPPQAAMIDGRDIPPGLPCPARALIKGDHLRPEIAAASIVAKVVRDAIMRDAERHFPGYGFARNAGYPSAEHRAALPRLGLTPLHRLSFAPCRALLDP